MMENRSIFAFNGLIGFFIAVALLLSILVYLTIGAISVQQTNSENFYVLDGADKLKMINNGQDGALTPQQAADVWHNVDQK
jgi:hypothetical protein